MKRPLFDMIDRQIIIEDNSFYASRLQLAIAWIKVKREVDRIITPIFLPITKWLANNKQKHILI